MAWHCAFILVSRSTLTFQQSIRRLLSWHLPSVSCWLCGHITLLETLYFQTLPGSSPAVSPTASLQAPTTPDQSPPPPPVAEFHTEDEVVRDKPTTPSKEELETNEKNLSIGKLGQLVFKIRYGYSNCHMNLLCRNYEYAELITSYTTVVHNLNNVILTVLSTFRSEIETNEYKHFTITRVERTWLCSDKNRYWQNISCKNYI